MSPTRFGEGAPETCFTRVSDLAETRRARIHPECREAATVGRGLAVRLGGPLCGRPDQSNLAFRLLVPDISMRCSSDMAPCPGGLIFIAMSMLMCTGPESSREWA